VDESSLSGERGLQEALRAAVERTLAATAGSAAQQRGRAQELLDEVARRGQEARASVTRHGQDAREASSSATARVIEAIREMRLATGEEVRAIGDEVRAIGEQLDTIERRVATLERAPAESRPEVEGD
jgi:polyhydroxyalkanoate synthesis regulator phasin